LVPTPAEAAQQQAEEERLRAERAEAELERLKSLLQAHGIEQEPNA
jgi:hypothetical protein